MGRSWTFGQKLATGFAAVVLLNVLVTAAAIYALLSSTAAKDRVIEVNAKILIDAQKMQSTGLERVGADRGYLLTGDEKFLQLMQQHRQRFVEYLDGIRGQLTDRDRQQMVNAIGLASNAQSAAADRVNELRRSQKQLSPEAIKAFQEEVVSRNEDLNKAINDLVSVEERDLNDAKLVASKDAATAITLSVAFAALSVLVAAVLAFVLAR